MPHDPSAKAEPVRELHWDEDSFPLLRLIDAVRTDEARLREKVELRRGLLAIETGLEGAALTHALAQDLIFDAKLRSATIGAGFALPWMIPLLGFWGTLALTVLGAAWWQTVNEVELVYELAYVYRSRLEPDRLRLTSFWLVQLTNYDDLRERALETGVSLTVRKLVEKLIAVGLMRASGATAHSLIRSGRTGGPPRQPWFVRATEYIGVPVCFYVGWKSTSAVGRRALAYFEDEQN